MTIMLYQLPTVFVLFFLQHAFSLPLNISDSWFKIAGGQPANIQDYPYQVAIKIDKYICGGSILNQHSILTAAHCVYEFPTRKISIRAGSNYRDSGGISIPAAEVYVDPSFDKDTYDYDVAIIRLQTELNYDDTIKPIRLPPNNYEIETGRVGIVTGYGTTSEGGQLAKSLQEVELPLVSTEDCQQIYTPEWITERMFCAGYVEGGKDACGGDSGGPLVLDSLLIGIISYDIGGCAEPNHPGVYTKVSAVRNFIDSIINE